jgi:hypothetical protein
VGEGRREARKKAYRISLGTLQFDRNNKVKIL